MIAPWIFGGFCVLSTMFIIMAPRAFSWKHSSDFKKESSQPITIPLTLAISNAEANLQPKELLFELKFSLSEVTEGILLKSSQSEAGFSIEIAADHSLLFLSKVPRPFGAKRTLIRKLEPGVIYSTKFEIYDFYKMKVATFKVGAKDNPRPDFAPIQVDIFEFEETDASFGIDAVSIGALADQTKMLSGSIESYVFEAKLFQKQAPVAQALAYLRLLALFLLVIASVLLVQSLSGRFPLATADEKTRALAAVILLFFAVSSVLHFYRDYFLNANHSVNSFLFINTISFTDFWGIRPFHLALDPYSSVGSYPPFMYVISYPILALFNEKRLEVLAFILFFLISFASASRKMFSKSSISEPSVKAFVICCLSYPALFLIDRGNLDLIVMPIIFWGLIAFHEKQYTRSSVLLSIATAMKLSPALFLIFFFKEKKYRQCLLFVFLTLALNILSATLLKDGVVVSFQKMYHNISVGYVPWTLTDFSIYSNHSLKGLIRILSYNFFGPNYEEGPQAWHRYYQGLSLLATLSIFAFVFVRFQKMDFWKSITLITLTSTLFPMFSPDYKLMPFSIGVAFFLVGKSKEKNNLLYLVLFSIILIPKEIIRIPFVKWMPYYQDIGLGAVVTPIALLLLLLAIIGSEVRMMRTRI